MVENRSQNAAHYGALAERAARNRYDLEADRDDWHDAVDGDGDPWDVKAAMLSRRSPRFRLWREQHKQLSHRGGGYVFVGYLVRGRGIQIKAMRAVRASNMDVSFYSSGRHPKGPQAKIPPSVL